MFKLKKKYSNEDVHDYGETATFMKTNGDSRQTSGRPKLVNQKSPFTKKKGEK